MYQFDLENVVALKKSLGNPLRETQLSYITVLVRKNYFSLLPPVHPNHLLSDWPTRTSHDVGPQTRPIAVSGYSGMPSVGVWHVHSGLEALLCRYSAGPADGRHSRNGCSHAADQK